AHRRQVVPANRKKRSEKPSVESRSGVENKPEEGTTLNVGAHLL
ncbi:DNA repair endonuclease XPF, partial [Frankliniella fusca]